MPSLAVYLGLAFLFVGCATAPRAVHHKYGERVTFDRHATAARPAPLQLPDFAVRFESVIHSPPNGQRYVTYTFAILDSKSHARMGEFAYVTNGRNVPTIFTVAGQRYAIEMFYTNGSPSGRPEELKSDEFIIWNAETARARNPMVYHWTWIRNRP